MTIRKLHSNNTDSTRASIAKDYTELYFDDATNSILLPDPTGLLETKIGAGSGIKGDKGDKGDTGPAGVGIKGFAAGYVDAGQFVTLDNLKFTVTTGGQRGLTVAAVTGTVNLMISGTFGYISGVGGSATNQAYTYTTTPNMTGSWFGWSFPNQGDGSVYLVNDVTNYRFYRVTLMIGPGYIKNFISIERLY